MAALAISGRAAMLPTSILITPRGDLFMAVP
jgi:hypothetical protein